MYNVDPPSFPSFIDHEHLHLSTVLLPFTAGMRITNGPYGALSSPDDSTGEVHAVSRKELAANQFHESVNWILQRQSEVGTLLFAELIQQYAQWRSLVMDFLADDEASEEVPEISDAHDLFPLCGISALHVGEIRGEVGPSFSFEIGCAWDEEHGIGVRFDGLEVVAVGQATEALAVSEGRA